MVPEQVCETRKVQATEYRTEQRTRTINVVRQVPVVETKTA